MFCDTTDTYSVAAGDLLSLRFVNAATASSADVRYAAMEIEAMNGSAMMGAGNLGNIAGSQTQYCGPFNPDPGTESGSATHDVPMPRAGTIKNLYVATASAQPGTGSLVMAIYKSGVATGLTVTVAASAAAGTFSDTIDAVTIASGDVIKLQLLNNSSLPSAWVSGWACEFAIS